LDHSALPFSSSLSRTLVIIREIVVHCRPAVDRGLAQSEASYTNAADGFGLGTRWSLGDADGVADNDRGTFLAAAKRWDWANIGR
jgi:hypothetical protein